MTTAEAAPAAGPKPPTPAASNPSPPTPDPAARVAHRTFTVQLPSGPVRVVAASPDGAVATARALYGLDESAPVTVVEPTQP